MDGRLHARLPIADGHETFELNSLEFGDWLIERYRAERNGLPPGSAVARVVRAVAARARFAGGTPSLHVRIGRGGDSGSSAALSGEDFYLDLGDSSGQAYRENRQAATFASLEDSAVASALLSLAEWGRLENWTLPRASC
jgi:hypothetical protein